MSRSERVVRVFAKGLLLFFAAVISAPVAVLWLPGSWKRHVYYEISIQLIAKAELPRSKTPEETVQTALDYTRKHLWLIDRVNPYPGKPFDYLVEGIGWCDYHAKVFCKLLAARGIHARYAFLKDRSGASPHTVAEVYLHGQWRALDPFFNLIYAKQTGEWASLEELTPEFVGSLPQMELLRNTNSDRYENIIGLARKTYPLPAAPQRSDDFVSDKQLFDWLTDAYVGFFGRGFAYWYQDRFLGRKLAAIHDPADRLWYKARNYHLYGRLDLAEQAYRQLIALNPPKYRERTKLFLSRLLIRQKRFKEAYAFLQQAARELPEAKWPYFQLALCDEALGNRLKAVENLRYYQQLHGGKFALEAAVHLKQLQQL